MATPIRVGPWTDCASEYYVADASDTSSDLRCPRCNVQLSRRDLRAIVIGDEIAEWRGTHRCGADLIIIND